MDSFPARRDSDQRHDSAAVTGLTALVVDDESSYRAAIASVARRVGFTADEACDAAGAYSLLANAAYDALLLNGEIAGIDALEMIARLRASEPTRQTYAVLLTARFDAERNIAALAAGFDDLLSKSATELEIVARLVAARRLALRQQSFDRVIGELYGLAARDELTGVFNRRFFMFEAETLLRKGEPFSIVLFDLDGFKSVNDTFGHLTGDRVLRDIGALFQRTTRPEDLLARLGGDEFVMLLPRAGFSEVEHVASRLRQEIRELRWVIGDRELSVGVTVGVSSTQPLSGPTLAQLIEIADRDLYEKKRAKREDRPLPLPPPMPEHRL